jgi:hypothetical protein
LRAQGPGLALQAVATGTVSPIASALAQEPGPGWRSSCRSETALARSLSRRGERGIPSRTPDTFAVRRSGRLGGLPLLAALLHDLWAFAALDPMSALCAAILSSLK